MGFIILTLFAAWIASAAIRAKKECDRKRAIINHRLNKLEENQEILAQNVLINRRRMDSFEDRWTEYTRKADAKMAKVEATVRNLEFKIEQAEADIDFLKEKISRLFEIVKYEENERDKCAPGSAEYYKHERKVITLDNQIRTANRQLEKAFNTRNEAVIKLEEVA